MLYIDIDCLRPDHLGCYGYARDTSPNIDRLASEGLLLANCHTSDAPCLPSRAALFSGRFGINNGVTCHDGPASRLRYAGSGHSHHPEGRMLMRVFQDEGWNTVSFSGFAQRHVAWWYVAGFTEHHGSKLPGGSEHAHEVNELALDWLRRHGSEDKWFLHAHFWDVHTPYVPPEEYIEMVADQPLPAFPDEETVRADYERMYGSRTARDWWGPGWESWNEKVTDEIADRGALGTWFNALDGAVRYTDYAVGQLLDCLEELGIADETVVIVSSDHGEAVGELGMYFEHGNASEGCTHIPLIIRWPGRTDGGPRSEELIYQLDLCPTLTEMLGMPTPSRWDGRSFAPALRGEPFEGRPHLVCGCGIYSFQRAVRTPRWRLIRTIHSGIYPYEPVYLFDMENDPNQRVNVAEQEPEALAETDHLLSEWWHEHCTGSDASLDPFQLQMAAGHDPDLYCGLDAMLERLKDMGREEQYRDLVRRRLERQPLPRPWGNVLL
ncbi:MAG: sulfatase [Candidatus Brocadiaceae bacterium]|jgi:arylsulfatase A-like enzyme